jgi:hypothetical protein
LFDQGVGQESRYRLSPNPVVRAIRPGVTMRAWGKHDGVKE